MKPDDLEEFYHRAVHMVSVMPFLFLLINFYYTLKNVFVIVLISIFNIKHSIF